jgi:hypothetical protein
MALLRERVPAGVAALVGVALATPSVVAPTWRLTTLDSERGLVLFDQQDWGWGRSEVLGAGGTVVQDLWNPFGLALLIGLLALTAAGSVAWLVTSAQWAVAAPLASAALLGRLATTASERHGRAVRDDVHGLAATGATTVAGALESLAAVALVVAVVLMLLSLVGWRMPSAWVARLERLAARDPAPAARDVAGSDDPTSRSRAGGRPVTVTSRPEGVHLSGPPVGLGDVEPDPPAREEGRS